MEDRALETWRRNPISDGIGGGGERVTKLVEVSEEGKE